MPRIGEILKESIMLLTDAGVDTPALDTQLIVSHAIGSTRLDVIAHPERELTDDEHIHIREMIRRRMDRLPLAYILRKKLFYGIELYIEPGVLVPRPETETLIDEVVRRIAKPDPVIADIGSGSGAIAVAVAAVFPDATVYAVDISPKALEVTRKNAAKHHPDSRVIVVEGDMCDPLKTLNIKFDAIISNPPYIPSGDIDSLQPEVSRWEPGEALDGGPDGLDAYRKLFAGCRAVLREDGFVAVEIGQGQSRDVRDIAGKAGYLITETATDLAGINRVVIAGL